MGIQICHTLLLTSHHSAGFPGSSLVEESTSNAGDPGSVPGFGRSTAEGIDYPLQHSWASLMAQLVRNLPAMWETWVWSLAWEDSLEKGTATHSSILACRIPCDSFSLNFLSPFCTLHPRTYFVTESLYIWPPSTILLTPPPSTSGSHQSVLCIYELGLGVTF